MKTLMNLLKTGLVLTMLLSASCSQNKDMIKIDNKVEEAVETVKKTEKKVTKKTEILVSNDVLKNYVGKYELAPSFIITITVEGNRIFAQATGQGNVEIFPKSKTEFYYKVVDAQIVFTVNENKVEKLTLYQSGQVLPAIKIN